MSKTSGAPFRPPSNPVAFSRSITASWKATSTGRASPARRPSTIAPSVWSDPMPCAREASASCSRRSWPRGSRSPPPRCCTSTVRMPWSSWKFTRACFRVTPTSLMAFVQAPSSPWRSAPRPASARSCATCAAPTTWTWRGTSGRSPSAPSSARTTPRTACTPRTWRTTASARCRTSSTPCARKDWPGSTASNRAQKVLPVARHAHGCDCA
mmetsp:Transcript_162060/g.519628  ORF Transcript_162060/g.519628 Transcript_162060/m.519628 type:complete len:211 (-) Transcript_162060:46-678(-)